MAASRGAEVPTEALAKVKLDAADGYLEENMLEEADLDLMARIDAQNDEKDRENAERAAASKRSGPEPVARPVVVVSSAAGVGGLGGYSSERDASCTEQPRRKLDPNRVPSFW